MILHLFVSFCTLTILAIAQSDLLIAADPPPNFVWIIADDMSPDIGAYGSPTVHTPNLDRLAAEGRRYTRAYATAPVCSSSRSAFILGCYQTTTGLHAHDVENPQPLAEPYRPLPTLLREAGWYVTNSAAPGGVGKKASVAKTHYNFQHSSKEMFNGDDWRKRSPGQPFFAQFQISQPHRSFPIPDKFDEAGLSRLTLPENYPDHPLMRRDWYAYERNVETVDARVGAILDELAAEGVLENTIVMFFADHGRPMPWGKQWLSVEGLQVPLIICGPSIAANHVEERLVSLIDLAPSMLQLAHLEIPKWMQGASILNGTFPERSQIFAARDRCGDAQDRIRALIAPNHLFVRNYLLDVSRLNWSSYKETSYPGMPLLRVLNESGKLDVLQASYLQPHRPENELYDLQKDPKGLHSVSNDPNQQSSIVAFQKQLDDWIVESKDQGALPDPATEPSLPDIQKDKRGDYQRSWKARLGKTEPTDQERLAWWLNEYGLNE